MCGILGIFGLSSGEFIGCACKALRKMDHRGPDNTEYVKVLNKDTNNIDFIGHNRLTIVDVNAGNQPFENEQYILSANGEIYNHAELRAEFDDDDDIDYKFTSESDCEVIIPTFMKYGFKCFDKLQGIFAFILYDKNSGTIVVARDPIGVIPLYFSISDTIVVASEMKS